ncbi:MAG: type II toxin-antitoxin system RelE/ParE family toxin [Verrucomicrobiales bacterium]|jgi:plasmid stabilization system protein ParE|nr:type II toxin-antitoxin system RelE/ParE family toxin [Verrucomicrobiales bacterium]MBP9223995.1 type II toxin-antitoxin system RelE/ParE family toxin [Verrucomicrobiales bacterium]
MKLSILPSALEDLRCGWQFYDEQQEGLGDYFLDSLFSDIESLNLFPGIHRVVYGYYRLLSKRFPYAVYYDFDGVDQVLVLRVLDMRRDPASLAEDFK